MINDRDRVLPGLYRVLAPSLLRSGASGAEVERHILAVQEESGIGELAEACRAISEDLQAAADRDFKAFHDEVVALPADQWRAFLSAYNKLCRE